MINSFLLLFRFYQLPTYNQNISCPFEKINNQVILSQSTYLSQPPELVSYTLLVPVDVEPQNCHLSCKVCLDHFDYIQHLSVTQPVFKRISFPHFILSIHLFLLLLTIYFFSLKCLLDNLIWNLDQPFSLNHYTHIICFFGKKKKHSLWNSTLKVHLW